VGKQPRQLRASKKKNRIEVVNNKSKRKKQGRQKMITELANPPVLLETLRTIALAFQDGEEGSAPSNLKRGGGWEENKKNQGGAKESEGSVELMSKRHQGLATEKRHRPGEAHRELVLIQRGQKRKTVQESAEAVVVKKSRFPIIRGQKTRRPPSQGEGTGAKRNSSIGRENIEKNKNNWRRHEIRNRELEKMASLKKGSTSRDKERELQKRRKSDV